MSANRRTVGALTAMVPVAVFALAGCSTLSSVIGQNAPAEVRDGDSGAVVEAGTTDVFSIKLGDCLIDTVDDVVSEIENVPCSEPHDFEVYYRTDLTVDTLPTNIEDVWALADEICEPAFEQFVGIPYAESELGFTHFTPTEGSWADGDRTVDCLVVAEAPVTGSLAGAAR